MTLASPLVVTYLGVISIATLLVAMILLLHLIQQAFDRAGVIWGMISIFYPPGTYLYCRRNWDILRGRFVLISGLVLASVFCWIILKLL